MDGNHLGKWTGAVQYFIPPVLNRLKVVDGDVERKCHFFICPVLDLTGAIEFF